MPTSLSRQELLESLPPVAPHSAWPQIQAQVQADGRKLFILDDDPLGSQTSYDLPIITDWSIASLRAETADSAPACFVLTNSRSMAADTVARVYENIGRSLAQLEAETGQTFHLLTRCDSTLRGHFPGEVEALQRGLGRPFDACLFIPFLGEGGRLTIHDIHYVTQGDQLIPAAQSPYAQDALFGYHASNLRDWVLEKMNGRLNPKHITSISLTELRQGSPEQLCQRLEQLNDGAICIVNAAHQHDLEQFVQGLLLAEAAGKRFLYRTAAAFIPARLGLAPRPLLTAAELKLPAAGAGLSIIGSHVPQTNRQLQALLADPNLYTIEVNVAALLTEPQRSQEIQRVSVAVNRGLHSQRDSVIYTSRQPVLATQPEQTLQIGQQIGTSLAAIVNNLTMRPRYLLLKGGITASTIATQALGVRRAQVLGQLLPGVPVWRLGEESRFPDLCYVVFPGNVGDTQALETAVTQLRLDDQKAP